MKRYLFLSLGLLLLDQWSKHWVMANMALGESWVLSAYLSMTHVHNPGAAFSLLADDVFWQKTLLLSVSVLLSLALAIWMYRTPTTERLKLVALSLILGGALGNLYDRISLSKVVDFIDLHYNDWYWPVFNLADTWIVLGVILLLIADSKKT